MRLIRSRIEPIQHRVLDWYAQHQRDLPWRRTRDPYAILVSEVMLQQTQVSRVVPKYHEFLDQFPTVEVLAAASPAAVIRAWQGLGYNRRALNLQRTTRIVVDHSWCPSFRYQGSSNQHLPHTPGVWGRCWCEHGHRLDQFPSSIENLMKLPGLGRYTAGAIATFAFGLVAPAVDTNVRQFIDAMLPSRRRRTESNYYALAARLIPPDRPAEWLHAVMDYASLVLRSRLPLPPPPRGSQSPPPRRSRKGQSEPFIGSNRYLRGRVIDRLRIQSESGAVLFKQIAGLIEVHPARFRTILAALERDGMIEHRSDHYQLPHA